MLSTRKSLAWAFSQEFIQKGVRFAGSIAIARLLTPDEVGVFAIAMAANFLLNSVREFGVGTYLIREPELTRDKIRTVFGLTLTIQWTLGALLLLARFPIAEVYATPGIADVLAIVAISFFLGPFGQPASALLRRDMRFDVLHHIGAAGVMVGTGTSVTLAALGHSYMSLAWGLLAGNVTRAALTLAVRRDHLRLRPGFRHWREVLRFGGWLTVAGLFGTTAAEGNKLVIGGVINPSSVALFERSTQIPRTSREILFMPIGRVLMPSFSKNVRMGIDLGSSVETYAACITALVWPAFFIIGLFSVPITVSIFGENWRVAGEIMPYLLASAALMAMLPQPEQVLTPHGAVKTLATFRLFYLIISISSAILGALHSIEMFSVLRIPSSVIYTLSLFYIMSRYAHMKPRSFVKIYVKSSALSVLTSLPMISIFLTYGTNAPIVALLFGLILSGLIWFSSNFVLRTMLAPELRFYLRQLRELVSKPT